MGKFLNDKEEDVSFTDYMGREWPVHSVIGINGKSAEWKSRNGEVICSDRMYNAYITTEWMKSLNYGKRAIVTGKQIGRAHV